MIVLYKTMCYNTQGNLTHYRDIELERGEGHEKRNTS